MSDIPCNNCGVKFSVYEKAIKDVYDVDQDFWRLNEQFVKLKEDFKRKVSHVCNIQNYETEEELVRAFNELYDYVKEL